MKKNAYFWIFIGVATLVCVLFLVLASNLGKDLGNNSSVSMPNKTLKNKDPQMISEEKVDLTQSNIDFEDDAEDLADDFVDDSQFDEVDSLESLEGEIY